MSRAGRGHGSSAKGDRRVPWNVVAWTVGTLIAVAGLALGVVQYLDSQREPMEKVCARAGDVQDSLLTVLRARINRLDSSMIDFDALHDEARELNGAANELDSTTVRRAASAVRQHLELVTAATYAPVEAGEPDTPAWTALTVGARELGVIRAECERQGYPVSEVPEDLIP